MTLVSGVTAGELKEFLIAHNVSIPTNTIIQDVTMGGVVGAISHVSLSVSVLIYVSPAHSQHVFLSAICHLPSLCLFVCLSV